MWQEDRGRLWKALAPIRENRSTAKLARNPRRKMIGGGVTRGGKDRRNRVNSAASECDPLVSGQAAKRADHGFEHGRAAWPGHSPLTARPSRRAAAYRP